MDQPPPLGEDMVPRYLVLGAIGTGTFSDVMLVRHVRSDRHYVVKMSKPGRSTLAVARWEKTIMRGLEHPNVMRVLDSIERRGRVCLTMPYVSGGDLRLYLSNNAPVGEEEARRIFLQLTSAMHYCHHKGVAHRDLKPENILMDSDRGKVIVTDFGMGHYFLEKPMRGLCGTPGYIAPEVYLGHNYGPGVDLWGLGVILHEMLKGHRPGCGPFEEKSNTLSSQVQHLLEGLLQSSPRRRMGWTQILCHPWVTQGSGPTGAHLEPEPADEPTASSMPFVALWQNRDSAPPAPASEAKAQARELGSPYRRWSMPKLGNWHLASTPISDLAPPPGSPNIGSTALTAGSVVPSSEDVPRSSQGPAASHTSPSTWIPVRHGKGRRLLNGLLHLCCFCCSGPSRTGRRARVQPASI
ncbi:sperm motility kinase 2B-like [Erinaceus europaeus]|uniref:non-specific serine/threonine protein kinase n=1 Tax=Erinaceus europaeus TaxID=9365 RepID=A0ABM3WEY7_ERIEU|nr:sperm motility kinase 2B-like [Erinaceus europaeus]